MQIHHSLNDINPEKSVVVTVGSFDGVHRGHQYLIGRLVSRASETGCLAAALTFHPHPRVILRPGTQPAYLTSLQERVALLGAAGLDIVVLIDFTRQFASTPADVFVKDLYQSLRMRELWVGPDFAMGRNKQGDVSRLRAIGRELGYSVQVVTPLMDAGEPISSTRIRRLLYAGDVDEAARLLGRPYVISAEVIKGAKRGRSLGFRTANLTMDPERVAPADGIYAVWAGVEGEWHKGVANLGVRPSFGNGERLLEVHLLDYDRDIYGKRLSIEFVKRLRPEERFEDIAALIEQIRYDVEQARHVLGDARGQHVEQPHTM